MQSEVQLVLPGVFTQIQPLRIYPVPAVDLTPSDLTHLARLDTIGYDGRSAKDLLVAISQGSIVLWRVGDKGIILTSLGDGYLWVEGLSGTRMDLVAKRIATWLRETAERAGKACVRCSVSNPQLQRIYARLGFRPVAVILEA